MDAANLLKPMLARGALRAVGATTLDEYRKYVEKDAALERRFQPVMVGEPSVEATVAILRGLKERYEVHHGVRIQDGALVAAARLSDRYITSRFLPDKAIDLMDEAASRLRIEIDSVPAELDVVQRRIMQLEIEQQALEAETDPGSVTRRDAIVRGAGRRCARRPTRCAPTGSRRRRRSAASATSRARSRRPATELERAEREADLEGAARLRYGTLPELERALEGANDALAEQQAHAADAQGGGGRGGRGRGRRGLDRHPPQPPARGRGGEAPAHGGAPARARRRPGGGRRAPSPTPCAARAPGSRTPTARSARSSSSARPAWGRPSSRARSPSSCSTTSGPWSGST